MASTDTERSDRDMAITVPVLELKTDYVGMRLDSFTDVYGNEHKVNTTDHPATLRGFGYRQNADRMIVPAIVITGDISTFGGMIDVHPDSKLTLTNA